MRKNSPSVDNHAVLLDLDADEYDIITSKLKEAGSHWHLRGHEAEARVTLSMRPEQKQSIL
jgi:hypothetical protein